MPKFIIKTGKYKGKTLKLPERTITIGRELECDIRVADSDVSRMHCELVPREGELYVVDLKSRNGTCVNDIPIQEETQLHTGDQLRVGPMVFELVGAKKNIEKPSNYTHTGDSTDDLSDDAISSWLSEEINESDPSPGDTTIISASQAEAVAPSSKPPASKPKDKKEYHSIAEEAADIIKKHWERVAKEEAESE
ncbi:MAG: FHA domain-containing protein [Gimesia sp.]|nr:FHA domain-containing protein [Planctomycetota bacterium]MDF1744763.1 FHA domain-containing protein [Gimesia sp.]